MKKVLAFFLATVVAAYSQQVTADTLTLKSSTPAQVGFVQAQVVGPQGSSNYYYWVVAKYPGGNATPAGPATITNGPSTLSVSNYINITWNSVSGATSYDVLKTTTPVLPVTGNTALVTSLVGTAISDTGGALSSYTVNTLGPSQSTLINNNTSNASNTPRIISSSAIQAPAFCFTGGTCFTEVGGITVVNSLPATCTVGQVVFLTTAPAGQNIYGCTSTNTWTLEGGSGSSTATCTVTHAAGTITIPSGCRTQFAGTTYTLSADATIGGGFGGGTGTIWIERNVSGVLTAITDLPAATCNAQCTVSLAGSGFTNTGRPLAQITVVAGVVTGNIIQLEQVAFANIILPGTNMTASCSNGICTLNASGGGTTFTLSGWLATIGTTEYFMGTSVPYAITAPPSASWTPINVAGTPTFAQNGSTRTIVQAAANDAGCEVRNLTLSGTQTLTAVISGTAWKNSGNPYLVVILRDSTGKSLAYGAISSGTITTRMGWERFSAAWAPEVTQVDANTDFGPNLVMKLTFSTTNVTAFSMSANGLIFSPTTRGIGTWAGAGLANPPDQIGWCVFGGSAALVSWSLL